MIAEDATPPASPVKLILIRALASENPQETQWTNTYVTMGG
jgi:hypothetical protein